MAKKTTKPLHASQLTSLCDPAQFNFSTTDELAELAESIGQTRALHAAQFGIGIERDGFNIFALGPSGVGKRTVFFALLKKEAALKSRPKDICYVHNFKEPRRPRVIMLDPGLGKQLREDMLSLVDILRTSIPAIFESEVYRNRIKEIQESTQKKQEEAFAHIEEKAKAQGLAIVRTNDGFMLSATKDGKVLTEDELAALPEVERDAKDQLMHKLHGEITNFLEQVPTWHKEQRQQMKEAFKYFIMLEVGSVIADVRKKYNGQAAVAPYLVEVQQAIIDNPGEFRKEEASTAALSMAEKPTFTRYRINLLVDNSELKGAPVIYEDNPSFANLIGRIEQVSQFGALVTDFTLLSAGALHKANGGYLLIDALKLLSQPYAWEGLKRALRSKEIHIENIGQMMGFIPTVPLEPKPVPLDIKVVLFGERKIYYLLCAYDLEFVELFKVAADFDEDIERNRENHLLFAQYLKSLVEREKLKALTKEGVARVIEYASRMVGDSKKMSTHLRSLSDLLREADHWANEEHSKIIDIKHIDKAIREQDYRASRIKKEQYEYIERGVRLIDTSDRKVGQINGLSFFQLGTMSFGQPTKISARVHAGRGELIDIERQVKLGGPIHSKGVLILSGYLAGLFAKDRPLSLSASLVFEQSYGGVEGDSASAAELCVLLSAIADIPLKQSIAMTGSINQHGHIQAIGGVNEKIEGFFDICKARGLNGEHGVIIPASNIDMLMLRDDVVQAARDALFHVFAVENVDQAMEILTGLKAGQRNSLGNFPRGSINEKVEIRLNQFKKQTSRHRTKDEE